MGIPQKREVPVFLLENAIFEHLPWVVYLHISPAIPLPVLFIALFTCYLPLDRGNIAGHKSLSLPLGQASKQAFI